MSSYIPQNGRRRFAEVVTVVCYCRCALEQSTVTPPSMCSSGAVCMKNSAFARSSYNVWQSYSPKRNERHHVKHDIRWTQAMLSKNTEQPGEWWRHQTALSPSQKWQSIKTLQHTQSEIKRVVVSGQTWNDSIILRLFIFKKTSPCTVAYYILILHEEAILQTFFFFFPTGWKIQTS